MISFTSYITVARKFYYILHSFSQLLGDIFSMTLSEAFITLFVLPLLIFYMFLIFFVSYLPLQFLFHIIHILFAISIVLVTHFLVLFRLNR